MLIRFGCTEFVFVYKVSQPNLLKPCATEVKFVLEI